MVFNHDKGVEIARGSFKEDWQTRRKGGSAPKTGSLKSRRFASGKIYREEEEKPGKTGGHWSPDILSGASPFPD